MSNVPQNARQHKNEVLLAGLLAKDPIIRFTKTGKKIATASLCTAVTAKQKTFTRIVAWEDLADLLEQRHTGDFIEVHGRLQVNTWDDAEGKKHSVTEVVVSNIAAWDAVANVKMEAGTDADTIPF